MKVTSFIDLLAALSQGQQVGNLRRSLKPITTQRFHDTTVELHKRLGVIGRDGRSKSAAKRRAAWNAMLETTATLPDLHESVAQLQSLEDQARAIEDLVAMGAAQVIELANRNIPEAILPEAMRTELDRVTAGQSDARQLARLLLELGQASNREAMEESLQWMTELRLQALNATLLSEIAAKSPDATAATESDLSALTHEVADQVRELRQAAVEAASELADETATPAFSASLWGALFEFEQWLTTNIGSRLAAAAAAASARVAGDDSDSERWARETGQAYDQLRQGLAYDAGVRSVLLAWALHDVRKLSVFAEARELPLESATLDLPRTQLADVADATEGEEVEIAALIGGAEFRVGGPSNRSVLSLGPSGAVRVLVPHVAVSSFGIDAGVWIQVRGQAHPAGKDGIDGPVVMAGRIRRAEAVSDSFTDTLIFAGRHSFELRPGEIDLVGGRIAGKATTLNEIGMRRLSAEGA
jgi:hypothetical protein